MESTNTLPSGIMIFPPFGLPEKETNEAYERAIANLKEDMKFTDEEMCALNAVEVYHEIYDAVKERIITDHDPEANINIDIAIIGSLLTMMSGADIVYFTKGATDDPDIAMLKDFAIRHKIQVGEEYSKPHKDTRGRCPLVAEKPDDEIYTGSGETKMILSDFYRGYEWAIYSTLGFYPSCYIHIPEDHELYCLDCRDIEYFCDTAKVNLGIHGGLSYDGDLKKDGHYWIGWDYAYCGDYVCMRGMPPFNPAFEHKWTVDELKCEIYKVIDTIVDKIDK